MRKAQAETFRRGVAPMAALLAFGLAATTLSARAEPAPVSAAAPADAPPGAAAATSDAADSANGRFAMTPTVDGFLRLDTRTGQVSLCTLASGQVQCRASADERAALEAEIDRLASENKRLKAAAPAPPQAAEVEEERRFDRALDRAERFMRRMMQLFRDPGAKDSGSKTPPSTL
ncbi:hypothetical protein QM467_15660 [Rhodoblastus sp. 17X3]|uniref:hypothetical protein n=1 Tax=Rhodoblastus sp. 17X3 TaxID=3047026 RepID=UPI0024B66A5B|nr:hypothetical protein [Rhodoblastus sp. 17X3]MDI9849493.1 hypothetical protein [Rhodoblastus sp. 17X3]